MKQKIDYPEEFIGMWGKRYKLVKVYKNFALYETKHYRTCYNLETILREMAYKRNCTGG